MAQFQVPQFIETEPKIVGPLTLKQFGYIGVAGLLSFFLFFSLRLEIWLIITIILGLIACAFAFLKYNGRPFEILFVNAALYIWRPKLYLWQRKDAVASMPEAPKMPDLTQKPASKIHTLWLGMLTKKPSGGAASPVTQQTPTAPNPIVHPIRQGETGAGGTQILRDIKQRKQDQGY